VAETVTSLLGPRPSEGGKTVTDLLGERPRNFREQAESNAARFMEGVRLAPAGSPPPNLPKRQPGDPKGWVRTVSPEKMAAARSVARMAPIVSGPVGELRQGYGFGFTRRMDAAIAEALYGKEYGDEIRLAEKEAQDKYRKEHPVASTVANAAGMLLNPASRLGGSAAAKIGVRGVPAAGIAAAAGGTYGYTHGGPTRAVEDALIAPLGLRYLGTAALSGAQSALYGFGEAEGDVKSRAQQAGEMGLVGAALGGITHLGTDIGSGLFRMVDAKTGYRIGDAARRGVNWVRSRLPGAASSTAPQLTGAERSAAERLRPAAARDRLVSRTAIEQARRAEAGMPPGNLMEVGRKNIHRALRVAGRQPGPATNMVREHADAVAANLPADVAERLGTISPYPGTAEQRVAELVGEQSVAAARDYRPAWSAPVAIDEATMKVLDDPEMARAMDVAARTARARSHADPQAAEQFKEIGALRQWQDRMAQYEDDLAQWKVNGGVDASALPRDAQELLARAETPAARERLIKAFQLEPVPEPTPPPVPEISGGTLDRIRIAARNRADSLMNDPGGGGKKATHALGTAIKTRADALDDYLDQVPHLQDARTAYRNYQKRIEAVGSGMKILDEKPENFRKYVEELPPGGADDLRVAIRDVLQNAAQGETGKAIALLKKIGRGSYGQQNLEALLGPEEADKLIDSANILRERLEATRYVAGVGASDTALNTEDAKRMQHMVNVIMSPTSSFHKIMDSVLHGGWKLNEEEAAAMIHFAQGDPQVLIDYLTHNPEQPFTRMLMSALATEEARDLALGNSGTSGDDSNLSKIRSGEK